MTTTISGVILYPFYSNLSFSVTFRRIDSSLHSFFVVVLLSSLVFSMLLFKLKSAFVTALFFSYFSYHPIYFGPRFRSSPSPPHMAVFTCAGYARMIYIFWLIKFSAGSINISYASVQFIIAETEHAGITILFHNFFHQFVVVVVVVSFLLLCSFVLPFNAMYNSM